MTTSCRSTPRSTAATPAGPLFAQDGTVIGVNTAIYSPSGGSVGIGFAIPSSIVKEVVSQLEANGKVARGYLGVSAQAVSPTMATALHMGTPDGALVAEVQADSPAASAGVKPGDVITRVGTEAVKDPRDLARIVADIHSGTEQGLVVRRDGQDKTLSVTIAAMRDGNGQQQADAAADHGAKLGLALAPLDRQARESLGLADGQRGVVIASVAQDSPAQAAGLQAGDVLEAVGGQAVTSPQQAITALRDGTKANGSAVALRVLRDGHQAFVALGGSDSDQG